MRVIIVHASAGKGHTKAAKAIYGYLKDCCDGLCLELVDVVDFSSPMFRLSYRWGYSFMVNRCPRLWHFCFLVTHARALRWAARRISLGLNCINTNRFADYIIKKNPEVIISTHFLPTETVSYLKVKKKITSRLITVITDFGVHDFWMSSQTDNYIVGTQYTRMQLKEAGVEDEKILLWGIPVEEKFFQCYERKELAKKIGVSPGKFTVLISTGSFGLGIIEKAVKALYPHVQLLVVCANNARLLKRLERLGLAGVKIYGFVPNIEELMAVSDLIITKPGGLTISECLTMEIVPVFITAIYGQESENLEVLLSMGIGWDCRGFSAKRIKEAILNLAAHPEVLYKARNTIKALDHIFPVEDLCHVVCKSSPGLANQRAV